MGARRGEAHHEDRYLSEADLHNLPPGDTEIVDLMVKYPDLIQRPIVEKGSRAVLARPADRLKEIIGEKPHA